MANRLSKFLIGGIAILGMTACASSSAPSNFVYETSLRGEQGFMGRADRVSAAETLLEAGVVTNPAKALQAALPNADITVRAWGLRYFGANWARYQVVLDADVSEKDKPSVKCRLASPDKLSGAPTLPELLANNGAEMQRRLEELIQACAAK